MSNRLPRRPRGSSFVPAGLALAALAALAASLPQHLWAQAATYCTATSATVTDNFKTTTNMDPITSVNNWGKGTLTLPYKAGAFTSPKKKKTGKQGKFKQRTYASAPGDFDGDGADDMVYVTNKSGCTIGYSSNTDGQGSFGALVTLDTGCLSVSAPLLASGDVNKDGLIDFVAMTTTDPAETGTVSWARLYVNNGTGKKGLPSFTSYDITSVLQSAGLSWHVSGSQLDLLDWDGDGDSDLMFLSSTNTSSPIYMFSASGTGFNAGTVILADSGLTKPFPRAGTTATGGNICMETASGKVSRGASLLAIADYNGDGRLDIVTGSTNNKNLRYFARNAAGGFNSPVVTFFHGGGPLFGLAADVDIDGDQDLILVRSGNDCGGRPGSVWIMNGDGTGTLTSNTTPLGNLGYRSGFALLGDFNGDGATDILAGGRGGRYQLFENIPSTKVYSLRATAVSKSLTAGVAAAVNGVVSVKFTAVRSVPTNTAMSIYVTNDGGSNWEILSDAEIAGGIEHTFVHYGNDLRWKALFSASAGTLTGADLTYAPGATVTPSITSVSLTYYTVDQRWYSRSGLAFGRVVDVTTTRDLLYGAAFQFPGWQGKLFAYDLTTLAIGGAAAGTLDRVDNKVPLKWEAGNLLKSVTGTSRTLYTAYPLSTSGANLVIPKRIAFSAAELSSPTSNPNLLSMMNVPSASAATIMTFLIDGLGDTGKWKFYDPGHSTPVFVGAPSGESVYLGNSYDVFAAAKATRTPMVYIGANDGFLHAFNALTGQETWAYVPWNLVSQLAQQYNKGAYAHGAFVDGPITVQDVYSSGAWHTVLTSGQGQGMGYLGNNYYFALDITDPSDPKPLWEFSDVWSTPGAACDGNPCDYACSSVCGIDVSTCTSSCAADDSFFMVSNDPNNLSNPLNLGAPAAPYGFVQAENYDAVTPSAAGDSFSSATSPALYLGTGVMVGDKQKKDCVAANIDDALLCASLTFNMDVLTPGNYYIWIRTNGAIPYYWGLDDQFGGKLTGAAGWKWVSTPVQTLAAGDHPFTIWMNQEKLIVDAVALTSANTAPPDTTPETCVQVCDELCGAPTCGNTCVSGDTEWPECGVGANKKCCTSGADNWCSAVGAACAAAPETVAGATLSAPAVGRIKSADGSRWIAFFASGYNNRGTANTGRTLYGVDAYTGKQLGQWSADDIVASASNPSTIDNTIPGAPALADVDDDGYVDRLYVGDLEGRLWKLNTSKSISIDASGAMSNPNDYLQCVLFDAGNINQGSTRNWAPILTKPAVVTLEAGKPNIYFGTGGDDRAPDTLTYKFYSVRDTDALSGCRTTPVLESNLKIANLEWVVGDSLTNTTTPSALSPNNAEGTAGDRYWTDPVVVNNTAVYFASLPGKIESVNPCLNLTGYSKVYGYAVQRYTDSLGYSHDAGTSLFSSPWLQAAGKIRQSALVRGPTGVSGTPAVPHGTGIPDTRAKSDVIIQEAGSVSPTEAPAIRRVTEGGALVKSRLKVLRWREVPM